MKNSDPSMTDIKHSIKNVKELIQAGLIEDSQSNIIEQTADYFSISITSQLVNLIDKDDPNDPIAKQFVPSSEELLILPEELTDPISDDKFTTVKGIIHRYPDRVLLKPIHICSAYCRFCFRKEKVGPGSEYLSKAEMATAMDYIRNHPEIWEVILSGGDPLILSPSRLNQIINELDTIQHVEIIRIHTRLPVMDPKVVSRELVDALKVSTPVYVVLHCNHPRELTEDTQRACAQLIDAGIPMLCQTVLLKGINDNPETMKLLLRKLIKYRIKPYYLHHGDFVKGTSHFRTSIEEGQKIMKALRGHISGICQPIYALDIPGGFGKIPIGPNYVTKTEEDDGYIVEDFQGNYHLYPPKANDDY